LLVGGGVVDPGTINTIKKPVPNTGSLTRYSCVALLLQFQRLDALGLRDGIISPACNRSLQEA